MQFSQFTRLSSFSSLYMQSPVSNGYRCPFLYLAVPILIYHHIAYQDAAGEIAVELQGYPDFIIGNYSDGNLVASLLARKMGVTQVCHCFWI